MSKFIKNLLYKTYIPICKTVKLGDFLLAGWDYVYETNWIKCTKTGYLGGKYTQDIVYDSNNNIESITEKNVDYASYIRIAPYEFGRLYNKLTQNYISKYGYYDVETHEYLGDFLRAIRDIKGINLMPFYNLYTDEFITNYRISEDGLDPYLTDSFKILKVPIKFNQKYTIALDCPSEVWVCPAFFRKDTPLTTKRQSGNEVSYTNLLNEYGNYIKNYSSMSFRVPILFEVQNTSLGTTYKSNVDDSDAEYFQQYERDLCLLIQIPSDNKSSVVILEGDYTTISQEYIVNRNEVYKLHDSEISDFLISNLSLLQFNTKENYVYSDRFIEYLLWNVITSQEEIVQNIELVQDLTPSARYGHTIFGIWDKALRFKVYDFSTQSSGTKNIDLNGFVDKDTEKLLMKQLF